MTIRSAAITVACLLPVIAFIFSASPFHVEAVALAGAFSCAAVFLVGYPAFLVMRRYQWLHVLHFAALGLLIGLLCLLPFSLLQDISALPIEKVVLYPSVLGAVHGILFWLMGIRGNNDATLRSGEPENQSDNQ